jgi:lipid-binding SYLF domain-containing protein
MRRFQYLILALLGILLAGCATTSQTPGDRRGEILRMRQDVLTALYRTNPPARAQIESAPGYAVFSNANVNLLIASFGGGRGVVHDAGAKRDTFMKMGEVGIGLGLGVKDFRAVFVFHNPETMKSFVDSGWEFGANADAAAKVKDTGGAVGGEVAVGGITVYQLTESGLALQATIKGTKYWKDDDLN